MIIKIIIIRILEIWILRVGIFENNAIGKKKKEEIMRILIIITRIMEKE